ncbi:TPA: glycosyltransferase [Vibrio parahaemolyticus]|uniref:glycosyltransferase n=1 Tax=Vibrio parahaemolyticus TaxID=670 RepID=UPI001A8E8A9D|nr:glycosyltransferase [Vibrio parahaemolyticus]MBO0171444.1 glycosyltransferase [Vibrio parahaemolyticus]HCE1575349.1 glycosyltransferase [Vibrio parahaemolyticus]HCG5288467.1 glycosyltransferase [Vibrio parahaemolyticus]HCG6251078.1 glycosyltransferase [Vibrio parahaemolyticus]
MGSINQHPEKKIDLVIDSLGLGGAERVCCNYANILVDKGYKVRILFFRKSSDSYLEFINNKVEVILVESSSCPMFIVNLIKIKFNLSDIIITFNHQISILIRFYILCSRTKKKIIARNVNFLSSDLKQRKFGIKKLLTSLSTKLFYRNMNAYIAQCNAMKEDMVSSCGIDINKISVVYNPVSDSIKYFETTKDIDILFVGRLSNQKGIEYLSKIIRNIIEINDKAKIFVIGKGDKYSYIEELLKEFPLNIRYLEKTDNVNFFYNRAKLTILTSKYEGFPNVLAESLKAKTPVVSFDCKSGPSEIIEHGVNGYLVPCYDTELFVQYVFRALSGKISGPILYQNESNIGKELNLIIDKL